MEARIKTVEEKLHTFEVEKEKMSAIDDKIFSSLGIIKEDLSEYKKNFKNHDEKEMEKYSEVNNRLAKIEKLIYMVFGAGVLVQALYTFNILHIGQ